MSLKELDTRSGIADTLKRKSVRIFDPLPGGCICSRACVTESICYDVEDSNAYDLSPLVERVRNL